ncbi:MAG: hypothetical protein PUB39_05955 [Eubacteriales bacterium]|nr:hypothetical protein [Eubacteriales bacterium]
MRSIRKVSVVLAVTLAFLLSVGVCFADSGEAGNWTMFQNTNTNNGVTESPAPDSAHAVSLWDDLKMEGAVTPPVIVGDTLYAASGHTVYAIDRISGKVEKQSADLPGDVDFAMHPMVSAKGTLYVTVSGDAGTSVVALNQENLKILWTSDPVPGENVTQLSYKEIGGNGYLYTGTGFYRGNGGGSFFCISADDTSRGKAGSLLWKLKDESRQFYWAGSYVSDKCAVFGSDTDKGSANREGSVLRSVNPLSGELISEVPDLKGNIRSAVVYDNGFVYFGTQAGRLYRIRLRADGSLAQPSSDGAVSDDFSWIDLGESVRGAVVVHNGRLYVGCGEDQDFNGSGNHFFAVLDVSGRLEDGASIIYKVPVAGKPTGAPILSIAGEKASGKVTLYFTCNINEGGIYAFQDSPATDRAPAVEKVFLPNDEQKQFCISPLAVSGDGILYYKNDSNHLMAIAPKLLKSVSFTDADSGDDLAWPSSVFDAKKRVYDVAAGDQTRAAALDLESTDQEVTSEVTVNGEKISDPGEIELTGALTEVKVVSSLGSLKTAYNFRIHKTPANDTGLSVFTLTNGGQEDPGLLPAFSKGKATYETAKLSSGRAKFNLWLKPRHTAASIKVLAGENVIGFGGKPAKAGEQLLYDWQEKDGAYRYPLTAVDPAYNSSVRVQVTSADGTASAEYLVRILKPKGSVQAPSASVKKPARVTGVKGKGYKKKAVLSWKKGSGVKGYEVVLAKNKKFSKGRKIRRVSSKKRSLSWKLKKGTYYFRVRAYKLKGKKRVYGSYSKTIKVRVK